MKKVYTVSDDKYRNDPVMAFAKKSDAIELAQKMHACEEEEAAGYVSTLPFHYEYPTDIKE